MKRSLVRWCVMVMVVLAASTLWGEEAAGPAAVAVRDAAYAGFPYMAGFPVAVPGGIFAAPVVAHVADAKRLAIVVPCMTAYAGDEGRMKHPKASLAAQLFAFYGDGSAVPGYPVVLVSAEERKARLAGKDQMAPVWFASPTVMGGRKDGLDVLAIATPSPRSLALVWPGNPVGVEVDDEQKPDPWDQLPAVDLEGKGEDYALIASATHVSLSGKEPAGWPVQKRLRNGYAPCVGDAAGDGTLRFYHPYYEKAWDQPGRPELHQIGGFDAHGDALAGWPQQVEGIALYPVMGDVNGDGAMEVCALDSAGHLLLWTYDGKPAPGTHTEGKLPAVFGERRFPGMWGVTLADLDGDGKAEILVASQGILYAFKGDGTGYARPDGGLAFPVTGDKVSVARLGEHEIGLFVGKTWVQLDTLTKKTTVVRMAPAGVEVMGACTIADVRGDGQAEVLFGSTDGVLFGYELHRPYKKEWMEWPTEHHDFQHTGAWVALGKGK